MSFSIKSLTGVVVQKSKQVARATTKGVCTMGTGMATLGREFKEGYKEGACASARKTLAKYESSPVSKEEQAVLLEALKKALEEHIPVDGK